LLKTRARSEASSGAVRFREKFMGTHRIITSDKYLHPKFFHAIGRRVTIVRAERFVRTNTAMGCCFSLCESTPDVPENIIPDPVVRLHRRRRRTRRPFPTSRARLRNVPPFVTIQGDRTPERPDDRIAR
jgi:hypothetical protein